MSEHLKSSLSFKIGSVLIAFVLIILVIGITVIQTVFGDIAKQNAMDEAEHQLAFAEDLMTIQDEQIRKNAQTYGRVFADQFNMNLFSIDTETTVGVGSEQTPSLLYNGELLNNNFSIPDRFTKTTGAVATIFVKTINKDGNSDFVRVTTSLKKEDGETRAIGTFLGAAHPAYTNMLQNRPFVGLAQLFGRNYATSYTPINSNGEVIGILFVGIDFTCELANLMQTLQHKKIGKSGYFFALSTKDGENLGKPVIHPALDKVKNIPANEAEAADIFQDMHRKGSGTAEYSWVNKELGETKPRDKTIIYSHFAPWNWMVAATVYDDDIKEQAGKIRALLISVLIAIAVTVVAVLTFTLKKLLSKPMAKMVQITKSIAGGDLKAGKAIQITSKDEIGILASSFKDMAENLSGLVIRLQQSSEKLHNHSGEFTVTVNGLTDKIGEHKDHIQQIASSASELSATTADISSNLSRNAEDVESTLNKAKEGERLILISKNSTYSIADIVGTTTETVVTLGEKSGEIDNIINVIKDIADQTNLLALNAAIEAARAGDHGRGFAVVADEVRKLAEKTSQSTSEIAAMVEEIQTSVKLAVQSMSEVNSKVNDNVTSAENISQFLNGLIGQLNSFNDSFQHLAASTEEMAVTSETISENLEGIAVFSEELEKAADHINSGSKSLEAESNEMTEELAVFKI
ncbi:methyl-accepting chemotaxis protein [Seleniivibrio woodruffii]|uniref:methyl-accepting chemotaxis protein n=1 Tax=Seleniivibrio woodruffii TaxID=1078050 RepID=UPI0026F2E7D9|nr:methyl-accepting chemotaxis protein [Seleniivibrio woodruffii]